MPIEIKELHIKVNVEEKRTHADGFYRDQNPGRDKDEIVTACVEKVLEVLKREKLR